MSVSLCIALTWWLALSALATAHTRWAIALSWPSTVLHEFAHFSAAVLTGSRPTGMSVWPKRVEGGWQLGSVAFYPSFWTAGLVALAPLAWFFVAGLVLRQHQPGGTLVDSALNGWLGGLLLAAGSPSRTDWGIALRYPGTLLVAVPIVLVLTSP